MFYHISMIVIRMYFNIKFKKVIIKGRENIPEDGAMILCSNHKSNFDPILICSIISRPVHYFAKKELFDTRFKRFWLKNLKAFPADRENTDIVALKKSISILKEGKILGIFAQGTRSKSGKITKAKNGVSLFALKGNANVIPIGIISDYKNGSYVYINIGKPITFDEYRGKRAKSDTLDQMTAEIMEQIDKLLLDDRRKGH